MTAYASLPLTKERLHELLKYMPNGDLVWKIDRRGTAYAGTRAGCIHKRARYWIIMIGKRQYPRSQLVWLWHKGEWPPFDLSHRNGYRLDDRIENLTFRNTSGKVGVHWSARHERWIARIMRDGMRVHLGYYDDFGEAAEMRELMEDNIERGHELYEQEYGQK